MGEDFVDGLLFEIKQEIIDNFFGERRRLEEERAACQELVEEQRARVRGLKRSQARLRRLLLDERALQGFCTLAGSEPAAFPPANVPKGKPQLAHRPRGLTLASRYSDLLSRAYEDLAERAEACAEGQAELEAALRLYREDVEHYQRNYDVLSIVAVLNRMAPEEVERRHWLGENFRPEETASLAESLSIRPMALPEELRGVSLALPRLRETRSWLKDLARDLCRRKPEEVRQQLARYLLP